MFTTSGVGYTQCGTRDLHLSCIPRVGTCLSHKKQADKTYYGYTRYAFILPYSNKVIDQRRCIIKYTHSEAPVNLLLEYMYFLKT